MRRSVINVAGIILLFASSPLWAQKMDARKQPQGDDLQLQDFEQDPPDRPQRPPSQECDQTPPPSKRPSGDPHRHPPNDPMRECLFPPELVMQNQKAIGLTDEQKKHIKSEVQKIQAQANDLQWQLQEEMEKLGSLLKPERVDEQQAMTQVNKVIQLENEMKRLQLAMLIRVKNKLTSEQQVKLREMMGNRFHNREHGECGPGPGQPMPPVPPEMQEKMQKVQAGMQRWQKEGRNPASALQHMDKFGLLMQAGKIDEAEKELDRANKLLNTGKSKSEPSNDKKRGGSDD